MALRLICVAQFFKPNKKGNVQVDDCEFLVDFFQNSAVSLIENEEDPFANETEATDLDYVDELEMDELQSLYYLSDSTVHQYIKFKKSKCSTCLKAIKTSSSDETTNGVTTLKKC
jgi:hypothetical protein